MGKQQQKETNYYPFHAHAHIHRILLGIYTVQVFFFLLVFFWDERWKYTTIGSCRPCSRNADDAQLGANVWHWRQPHLLLLLAILSLLWYFFWKYTINCLFAVNNDINQAKKWIPSVSVSIPGGIAGRQISNMLKESLFTVTRLCSRRQSFCSVLAVSPCSAILFSMTPTFLDKKTCFMHFSLSLL